MFKEVIVFTNKLILFSQKYLKVREQRYFVQEKSFYKVFVLFLYINIFKKYTLSYHTYKLIANIH